MRKDKNNLVAYGILTGACLVVALIFGAFPELFAFGPPSWQLFLSLRGTVVISLLGLIGIFFLNRSSLRGLWDSDLGAKQKVLIPVIAGIVLGLVSIAIRRFTPVDAMLADFARSLGAKTAAPTLVGATLAYLSGGILINIVYFLILIPPIVYVVSDRLLKGEKQGVVYWSIATPLALLEPLTNPPLAFSIDAFGTIGAIGMVAFGAVFTMTQAWFMRRAGFVALVSVRLGFYAVTKLLYPLLYPPPS
jgi:hypothetical protein